LNLPKVF